MRTEKYSRYLTRMQALCGVDSLLTSEETHFLQYFQRNMRYAWESFEWPELCPTEERTPDADGIISLTQAAETQIGEVFAIWDADPEGTTYGEVFWRLTPDGIQIKEDTYDSVWVYFRERVPDYTGSAYAAGTAYVTNDQVYYSTTGKFYKALQSTTGNVPTNATYWAEVEIPYCLFEFAVQAGYADALLAEGMDAKASAERAKAEGWLIQEFEKVSRQQRQRHRHNVVCTHGSMQIRG